MRRREAAQEHIERNRSIAVLRPFCFAFRDQACWQMRDADSGTRADMLTARWIAHCFNL